MSTAAVRVVLVEDNDTFRQTLELLLGMRDEIEVVGSVSNGEDAVVLCGDLLPDVVLMDYRMPGLNGADATRAVLKACPTCRVVCLSASVSEREVEEVRAAGAVAVVTKDEDFDRLVATVCEAGGIAA
jgi:DNA-binding NarL/FixJ family response regulator